GRLTREIGPAHVTIVAEADRRTSTPAGRSDAPVPRRPRVGNSRFVSGGEVPATRFAWVGEDRIAYQVLVAGSGFEFDDRGDHELKGVPGTWQLFAVKPRRTSRLGTTAVTPLYLWRTLATTAEAARRR